MKNINKILAFASVILALASCNKDDTKKISSGSGYNLDGCTAVYVGTSTFSETETEGLTMYLTEIEDEYYIPKFFQGEGGIEFTWNKTTNEVRMVEGYAGVSGALTAMIIGSQAAYENLMGAEAKKSWYDPVTSTFTFYVLVEMADDYGSMSQVTTMLNFKITGEAE